MAKPSEHKTVQARILKYAEEIDCPIVIAHDKTMHLTWLAVVRL